MTDYAGRTVAVTGSASGIGAATARALVAQGAIVRGLDRHDTGVAGVRFVAVDLADPESIDRAADIVGAVDALFNCAGVSPTRPALEVIKVNLLGTRQFTDRIVARMAAGGAIVSTSSNGGLGWRTRPEMLRDCLATPDFAAGLAWVEPRLDEIGHAYRFTKEAITVWTMAQSARLIGRGIRINCTSPGAVATPMLDEIERDLPGVPVDAVARQIGRRSSPEEQAAPLLFLNGAAASYINGVDLPVDGGFAATRALDG